MSDKVRRACTRCGDVQLSGGDVVKALGHDYSVSSTMAWSGQSATCTFSCSRCGASETVRAKTTVSVKTPATCTEKGTHTYTATAVSSTGSTATDARDVVDIAIDPDNHDYRSEKLDSHSGTLFTHYVCRRDGRHQYWRNDVTGTGSEDAETAGYVDNGSGNLKYYIDGELAASFYIPFGDEPLATTYVDKSSGGIEFNNDGRWSVNEGVFTATYKEHYNIPDKVACEHYVDTSYYVSGYTVKDGYWTVDSNGNLEWVDTSYYVPGYWVNQGYYKHSYDEQDNYSYYNTKTYTSRLGTPSNTHGGYVAWLVCRCPMQYGECRIPSARQRRNRTALQLYDALTRQF